MESCCICYEELNKFKRKATPDTCEHTFCVGCLELWALKKDSCPMCRGTFKGVKTHGKRPREITVENLRKGLIKSRRRTKRRCIRRFRRTFNEGFAYTLQTHISPAGVPLQVWGRIPMADATPDDIADMEKVHSITSVMDEIGSRFAPIPL